MLPAVHPGYDRRLVPLKQLQEIVIILPAVYHGPWLWPSAVYT